jgi:hypothetical protein
MTCSCVDWPASGPCPVYPPKPTPRHGSGSSRTGQKRGLISPEARQSNIVKILGELHRRRIRTIEADGIINSARAAGMVQVDGIHLTVAGHRRVASQLIGPVR